MPWASQKRKINKRRHFGQIFKRKRKKIPFCIVLVISSELCTIRSRTYRTVSFFLVGFSPFKLQRYNYPWSKEIQRWENWMHPVYCYQASVYVSTLTKAIWGVCAEHWKQQLVKKTVAATAEVTKQSYKLKNVRGFMLWTPDGSRTVQFVNCTWVCSVVKSSIFWMLAAATAHGLMKGKR